MEPIKRHKKRSIIALALVFALAIGMVTPVLASTNDDAETDTELEEEYLKKSEETCENKYENGKEILSQNELKNMNDDTHVSTESTDPNSGIQTYASTSGNVYAYWDNTTLYIFGDSYVSQYPECIDITEKRYGWSILPNDGWAPWSMECYETITSVQILEPIYPKYTDDWFDCLSYVTSWTGLENIHMDYCVSATDMFCHSSFSDSEMSIVANYNMSSCENIGGMFYNTGLTNVDMSSWDMSSVTDMGSLFLGCENLETVSFPSSSNRVPHPTIMHEIFRNCTNLTTINNLDKIDTSATTDMDTMFQRCTSLLQIDLSSWNLNNVTSTQDMFEICYAESIKLPSSTSKSFKSLRSAYEMFSNCRYIQSVDDLHLECWDISNATNLSYLLYGCSGLVGTIDLSSWNFSNAPKCSLMFGGCTSVEYILFPTDTAYGPNDMGDSRLVYMFSGCTNLKEIDLSGFTITNTQDEHYGSQCILDSGYNYNDSGDLHMLQKITLGSGIQIPIYFPTTSSTYIDGADGNWYTSDGKSYAPDAVPAGAGTYYATATHFWDSGKVTKEATCGETGERVYTCTLCGATKTETIAKTSDHTWNSGTVTKAATCKEAGTKTYTCTVCGATKTETIAKTTTHTWDAGKVTKDSTCTSEGVKTYTCTVCGTTKTEAISATGHTEVIDQAVAPTCTTNGKTEGSHCSVCGAIIKEQEVLTATGHDYTDPDYEWQDSGAVVVSNIDNVRNDLVTLAKKQVGISYVSGGKSPGEGFDCSGLTYYLYKTITGIELPWNVADKNDSGRWVGQWYCGDEISLDDLTYSQFVNSLKPGDLVFMNENENNVPGHVAVYIGTDDDGNAKIIDASSESKNGKCVIEENLYDRWNNNPDKNPILGARRIIVGTSDFTTGAVMTLSCKNCDDVETIDCNVELISTVEPTCTNAGMNYYTAVGKFNGQTYTDTYDKEIIPKGHSFKATDSSVDGITSLSSISTISNPMGTIIITCEECGNTETISDCEVTMIDEKDPTCGTDGYITYTVTGEYNGKDYSSDCTIEVLATGDHNLNYADAKIDYNFVEGYATICVPCFDCDYITVFDKVPIQYDYTYGTWNEEEQKYEFESLRGSVSIQDANGNTYYWEEDTETNDLIDSQHNWMLVENIGNDPSCAENGYRMYVCTDDGCNATKTVTSSALGHNWNMNEESANKTADWSDDYSSCVLTFRCLRCNGTDTATSTSVDKQTNDGETITYTASVPFNGVIFRPTVTIASDDAKPQTSDDPGDDTDSGNGGTSRTVTNTTSGTGTNGMVNNSGSTNIESGTTAGTAAGTTNGNMATNTGTTTNGTGNTNTGTGTVVNTSTSATGETGNVKTGDTILFTFACVVTVACVSGIAVCEFTKKKKEKTAEEK